LATFAEFDLAPSLRGPVQPPPLRWVMRYLTRDQLAGKSRARHRLNIGAQTAVALQTIRGSDERRQAKEALLSQPLACATTDGYLAGYLYVKTLWRAAQGINERLREPDTFLLWAYDTFYEDRALMTLLLDPDQHIPDVLSAISQHVERRLAGALRVPERELNEFIDRLLQLRSQLDATDEVAGLLLPLADPLDDEPTGRFLAFFEFMFGGTLLDLIGPNPAWTDTQSMIAAWHAVGHSRNLVSLGELPVDLDVTAETVTVTHDAEVVAVLPTEPGAATGRSVGMLHVFVDTRNGRHVAAATVGPMLAGLEVTPGNEAARTDARRSVLGAVGGPLSIDIVIDANASELASLPELTRLEGYLEQTRERLDSMYLPVALAHVPEAQLEELVPKMLTDGVYGAFDYDADLVRAVAIIGSTAGFGWNPPALAEQFLQRGLDYAEIMNRLVERARTTHLFAITEDPVRCWGL
jgi:hypothetical protein